MGYDDLVFALQLIVRHAAAGAHPECCADLILSVRAMKAHIAATARGGEKFFTRALLTACQTEHESAVDLIRAFSNSRVESETQGNEVNGNENMSQCSNLFTFF